MKARIYLDYNATSPVIPEVCHAIADMVRITGNPSSIHAEGLKAKASLRKARAQVAQMVGCQDDQVIFTSSGTEANNMALSPLIVRQKGQNAKKIKLFIGATDHISVVKGGRFSAKQINIIPVNEHGQISASALSEHLIAHGFENNNDKEREGEPFLVSIMYANNETGCIQNISDLGHVVRDFGGLFHVDAVQALGKTTLYFSSLPVDFMSVSAHKMGGIQGAGALIAKNPDLILKDALLTGGGQEKNRRGGTEALPAILSFGLACEICGPKRDSEINRLKKLRAFLEEGLIKVNEKVKIVSQDAERLPNTVCFLSEEMRAENMLMVFDLANIAVSSGSACSSGRVNISHVLQAMGYSDELCYSAIRVSLGWGTVKQDIETFLTIYADILKRHKKYKKAA